MHSRRNNQQTSQLPAPCNTKSISSFDGPSLCVFQTSCNSCMFCALAQSVACVKLNSTTFTYRQHFSINLNLQQITKAISYRKTQADDRHKARSICPEPVPKTTEDWQRLPVAKQWMLLLLQWCFFRCGAVSIVRVNMKGFLWSNWLWPELSKDCAAFVT